MKTTGIVRRIDDLGRVVILKEIRRTMRIHEGAPQLTPLTNWQIFAIISVNRYINECLYLCKIVKSSL